MLQSVWLLAESVFHKTGAALLNARAPHRVDVFGSISKWAPANLSVRVGTYACKRAVIYSGASPFSALYTWMSNLYCTLTRACRRRRTAASCWSECEGSRLYAGDVPCSYGWNRHNMYQFKLFLIFKLFIIVYNYFKKSKIVFNCYVCPLFYQTAGPIMTKFGTHIYVNRSGNGSNPNKFPPPHPKAEL